MRYIFVFLVSLTIFSCKPKEEEIVLSAEKISLKVIGEFHEGDWMQIDNIKFIHQEFDVLYDEVSFNEIHSFDGELHLVRLPASTQIITIADELKLTLNVMETDFLIYYIRLLNAVDIESRLKKSNLESDIIRYRFEAGPMLHLKKELQFWKNDSSLIVIKHSANYPVRLNSI